ncbi:MAG: tryptophan synthase subunit alpha [Actinomycetota bacterium]|nr:tryptophan synthase subunit alpha [Actinomycetota bacterium]
MADLDLEAALRRRLDVGGRAFVPYVTGGLPSVTTDVLRGLEAAGADAIEVGIPFSDPVMDGPVIQEASQRALEAGATPDRVLDLVGEASVGVPVVAMTYLNPVLALGFDVFLRRAVDVRLAGVLVPDLPVDEAEEWRSACAEHGVASVFLAAPGTDAGRLGLIAEASSGFVYCVSTYGVTGERKVLAQTARDLVESLRPLTDRPLLVGVGVGSPEQAATACEFADGVVVGTALVRKLLEEGPESCLALAAQFRRAIPAGP